MNLLSFTIENNLKKVSKYENYRFIYEANTYKSLWDLYFNTDYPENQEDLSYLVSWVYLDKIYQVILLGMGANFFVDRLSGLIVVNDSEFNGKLIEGVCFYNLDGTINHKLANPKVVYCPIDEEGLLVMYKPLIPTANDDMSKIGFFPVEDIPASMYFDEELHSLVGQYYYIYDWVLYRKYDAVRREWGAIVGHSGHAG